MAMRLVPAAPRPADGFRSAKSPTQARKWFIYHLLWDFILMLVTALPRWTLRFALPFAGHSYMQLHFDEISLRRKGRTRRAILRSP